MKKQCVKPLIEQFLFYSIYQYNLFLAIIAGNIQHRLIRELLIKTGLVDLRFKTSASKAKIASHSTPLWVKPLTQESLVLDVTTRIMLWSALP